MKRLKQLNKFPLGLDRHIVPSPVGDLIILASQQALYGIFWHKESTHRYGRQAFAKFELTKDNPIIKKTSEQLVQYFAGERKTFDLPLEFTGTFFQKQAWQQLCNIPYGETISYGEQAKRLGDKNKARAVGMANGMNPISIVVPCHRVIGSNGSLTGFGGGLDKKALLLTLEKNAS